MRHVLIALGLLACGDEGDGARREARSIAERTEAKARGYGGGLVDKAGQAKHAAAALGGDVRDGVGRLGEDVSDRVGRLGEDVSDRVGATMDLGRRVKAELDKVYQHRTDYDLDITTRAATSAHAEKLAAMPHVTVGGVTVGYEQVAGLSPTGASNKRHFRATWRRGDRDVIVGYQTESRLDLAAFAALLPTLVPIVDRLL